MKFEGVRVISNGTVEEAVVSKETDFGARREAFMDVINVDKKEEGPRTVPWGTPERTGQGSKSAHSTRTRWVRPCRRTQLVS